MGFGGTGAGEKCSNKYALKRLDDYMEEYLTTDELSQRIKMAPGSIRNLVSNGRLILNVHYVKPSRKKILFMWSAVENWLYHPTPEKNIKMRLSGIKPRGACLIDI